MIKIDFEKTSADGLMIYRDALHLPDDHTYTDEDIEAMKQSRFDRWYLAVTTPPPDVPVEEAIVDAPTEEIIVDDIPVEEPAQDIASDQV